MGFAFFEGKMEEGLVVAVVGRLGGVVVIKFEVRFMGFLFDLLKVVGVGCLGREVGCVLVFDVEVFVGWVVVKGF